MVPGVLHHNHLPKVIELYFRVKKPMQSCTIVIRSGETVIRKIQKQNIVPSEMEIVSIVTDSIHDELIVEGIEND